MAETCAFKGAGHERREYHAMVHACEKGESARR